MLRAQSVETVASKRENAWKAYQRFPDHLQTRINSPCPGSQSLNKNVSCKGNQISGTVRIVDEISGLSRWSQSCLLILCCTRPPNSSTSWWIASRSTPFISSTRMELFGGLVQ